MANSLQHIQRTDSSEPFLDLSVALKAAADPLRLEILRVLAKGSYGVLELSYLFDIKQSAMSHHLKVLANAQLVSTRREGNSIFYRRTQPIFDQENQALRTILFSTLDNLALSHQTQIRLETIQQDRAAASQEFFAANADKFRAQQDLIASFSIYGEHVGNLLKHIKFENTKTALEIGPGQGEFLSVLNAQFEKTFALDNSINMLNQAKSLAEKQQLDNIEFVLGDTLTAIEKNIHADCIVINMVLHHVPSPSGLFQDAAALLNHNGSLLVTDLCRHDQQWATESCGDLWLGFEPQEFSVWAQEAGLTEGQSQYFALRNGFQIQLRHFIKGKL